MNHKTILVLNAFKNKMASAGHFPEKNIFYDSKDSIGMGSCKRCGKSINFKVGKKDLFPLFFKECKGGY